MNTDQYIFDASLEEQSMFVDHICKENALDLEFLKDQFSTTEISDFSRINITSIGNLAYVALHSPAPYNNIAKSQLNAIFNDEGCKKLFGSKRTGIDSDCVLL